MAARNERRHISSPCGAPPAAVLAAAVFAAMLVIALSPRAGRAADTIPYASHVVEAGDTLSSLAKRYYGDESQWPRIYRCNRWIADPDHLKVGQTIVIPEPKQGTASKDLHTGLLDWLRPARERPAPAAAPPPARASRPARAAPSRRSTASSWTRNPGKESAPQSWREMMREILQTQCFGRSLGQILLLVFGWFVIHMLVQGAFTWFAAHMAFVRDVSFKKAWRAAFQSETLAAACLLIVGIGGLAVIYVGTAPPGAPVVSELLMIAEQYLSTPTGMGLCGAGLIGLYVFLGIRFIPQAFEASGGQGFAIVLFSVLIPHAVFAYLVSYRLGFI